MTITWLLVLAAVLACHAVMANSSTTQRLRGASKEVGEETIPRKQSELLESSIVCRITIQSTLMGNRTEQEETMCIPIKDGKEWGHLLPIQLPEYILTENKKAIHQGRFVLQLSDAKFTHTHVAVSENTVFTPSTNEEAAVYYDDNANYRRVLVDRSLSTTGTMSIAIVRVSAKGARNKLSKKTLLNAWFGEQHSFKSQMEQCSFGALQVTQGAFYHVQLVKNITTYPTRDVMQAAIETKLEKMAKMSPKNIADKVVFCYPPGSPGGDWLALAWFNWYKALYNNGWCVSLSAGMHEMGHTIGLLHSEKDNDQYGDITGYMGYSSLATAVPSKCYNGDKNWLMGWYEGRRLSVTGSKIVRLAAFVDYDKAAANEPVLVQVNGKYNLQYNRAKSFNSGTELYQDKVTITIELDDGNSDNVAGIGVGETFNDGDTVIHVCSAESGTADVMILAIGCDCN